MSGFADRVNLFPLRSSPSSLILGWIPCFIFLALANARARCPLATLGPLRRCKHNAATAYPRRSRALPPAYLAANESFRDEYYSTQRGSWQIHTQGGFGIPSSSSPGASPHRPAGGPISIPKETAQPWGGRAPYPRPSPSSAVLTPLTRARPPRIWLLSESRQEHVDTSPPRPYNGR